MKLLSLEPEAFGMDFSDLRLRIAMLRKKGKFFDLVSWGSIDMPSGIIKDGQIQKQEKLVEIIKKLLNNVKGEKIRTRYVAASLPEKRAFLQVIKIPRMEKEELSTAVLFEAENYVPLPITDVYLDFQITPYSDHSDQLDILIAALPKKIIDPYVYCLEKAGLIPKALEVESQSIIRALIKNNISSSPLFIIDFGRSTTSFIVFSGSSLRFTSSVPISSYKLTEAISKSLGITLQQAEKLKKIGKNKKAIKAMTPLLIDLVQQAKKCISYYNSHNNHQEINKVLLCGNGANLKGLPDFICSGLKIPVEFGNPWVNILSSSIKKVPELAFKESLGYTTALGLALRGIKK